jgi:hypothetical protein
MYRFLFLFRCQSVACETSIRTHRSPSRSSNKRQTAFFFFPFYSSPLTNKFDEILRRTFTKKDLSGDMAISCYNRPSSTLIEGELNELLSQNAPTIAADDFNAKHPNWHSSRTNASGRVLVNYAFENDVIIVSPDEPTRYEWAFFPNTWTSSSRKMSLTKFE